MEPPPYHGSEVLKYHRIDEDICKVCLGSMERGTGEGGGGADSSVGGNVASSSSASADSSSSSVNADSTSSSSDGSSSSSSSSSAGSKTIMFTHVSHLGNEAWGRSLLLFHRCHRVSVLISEQGRIDGRNDCSSRGESGVEIGIGIGTGTGQIEKNDRGDQSRRKKNEKGTSHDMTSKKRKEVM